MLLFHALLTGPHAPQIGVLLLWMAGGGVLLLSILITVAIREPGALGLTATGEISAVSAGLGVILGYLFK
jgi:hypothetical protein